MDYDLVAHLFLAEKPFSRNQHFHAFRDPRFKRTLALYRRLRALTNDLERARHDGGRLTVTDEARGGVKLAIESTRTRMTTRLTRPAWDVLLLHDGAKQAVDALTTR